MVVSEGSQHLLQVNVDSDEVTGAGVVEQEEDRGEEGLVDTWHLGGVQDASQNGANASNFSNCLRAGEC